MPVVVLVKVWGRSWTRTLTCLLRTSGFCRAENCGGSAVPVLRQESVQLLDHGGVVPVVVQRQMVGETLLLVLFSRKSSTFFLEPLSDSPSRGVYASVIEAFGRLSQLFLCELDCMQFLDRVLARSSWCNDSVARRFGVVDVPVIMQRGVQGRAVVDACSRGSRLEIWCIIPLRSCIWQSRVRCLGGFFGR